MAKPSAWTVPPGWHRSDRTMTDHGSRAERWVAGKWPAIRAAGLWRFVLLKGVAFWGGLMFLAMLAMTGLRLGFDHPRYPLMAAIAGGCGGFLVWNFHPAKVFMGDTGSMFLGGAVVATAFCMQRPELLLLLGIVYICEAASVVLQVSYFKITHGKRIFKMSPIHHHFEMSGWSEVKIVSVFSFVTLVFVVLGFLYVYVT